MNPLLPETSFLKNICQRQSRKRFHELTFRELQALHFIVLKLVQKKLKFENPHMFDRSRYLIFPYHKSI